VTDRIVSLLGDRVERRTLAMIAERAEGPSLDCPDRDALVAFSLGKLPEPDLEAIARKLEACSHCRSNLESLGSPSDELLASLAGPFRDEELIDESACREMVERAEAMAGESPGGEDDRTREGRAPEEGGCEVLPRTLGQYRLLEKLGRGGMGAVYKALHLKLEKHVALKVLAPERLSDPQAVARFLREMRAVGRLDHRNIVGATDAGESGGTHFLVMELVEGLSLQELVRRVGKLPVAEACETIRQAAEGLAHAHAHGLVHRDVKPSNLLLGRDGRVKILDLGLARLQLEGPESSDVTATGVFMGTADYMAPEQAGNPHGVDHRADIYGLGCTLYKLLAGRAPFEEGKYDTALKKMLAHAQAPVPPLRKLRPEVPEVLERVVRGMLEKEAGRRPETAGAVARALEPFAAGSDLAGLLGRAEAGERDAASAAGGGKAAETEPVPAPGRGGRRRGAFGWFRGLPVLARAALILFFGGGLYFLGDVVIRIRHMDGTETVIETDKVRSVEIEEKGKPPVKVLLGDGKDAGPKTAEEPPPAEPGEAGPAVAVAPWEPGAGGTPMSPLALVTRPAKLKGLRSWTIETRLHRGNYHNTVFWHKFPILAVASSTVDATLIAAGGNDGSVRIWDTQGVLKQVFIGHESGVRSLAWSPDGAFLASGSMQGSMIVWDLRGRTKFHYHPCNAMVYSLAWSPRGDRLAAGAVNSLFIWEIREDGMNLLRQESSQEKDFYHLDWSRDGEVLATGGDRGVNLWGKDGKDPTTIFEVGCSTGVAFSPTEDILAFVVEGGPNESNTILPGPIKLWDLRSKVWLPDIAGQFARPRWSKDGRRLAAAVWVAESMRGLRIWNMSNPEPKELVPPQQWGTEHEFVPALAFSSSWSPNGEMIAIGGSSLKFWNGATGKE
jgi:WD40 repeat protein